MERELRVARAEPLRGLRCLRPSLTTCCYRILNGIHQRVTVDLKKQLAERTS